MRLLEGDAGHELYLSRLGVVEIAAAIFGKVKAGEARSEEALSAVARLRADIREVYQIVEFGIATAEHELEAAELYRLRAYDCLQLATALLVNRQRATMELAPLILVSSDTELNAAAQSEGLTVEDPASP